MAYGQGRSLLFKEYGEEEAAERARYEREMALIDYQRKQEAEDKGLLSFGLKTLGAIFGGPHWMVLGDIAGKTIADYAHPWEDKKITTDPGRFERQQQYDFEQANIDLAAIDEGDFWRDVADVGTTALTSWKLTGGTFDDPFAKNKGGLWQWDKTGSSAWDLLFPSTT